ncbi:BCCT family transporter [Amphritea sp. 1_MG-2023]|uniref:BCCT family transporter n=1 Tax=Amphritea sp. 1_MG-2023 TaxID=3062670 RepID=UPI0026E45E95|nr:BCCT family transporter [Amphritea sp. 1_MG-2023]MDO6565275.1 BCCT family transporter [Amphritea sp. 1_MG-2023]
MNEIKKNGEVLNKEAPIDKKIFWPASLVVTAVIMFMITFEESSQGVIKNIFNFVTNQFGFVYIWAGVIFFASVIWISLGKFGSVRLGGAEASPEFSRISWIAMFFCSGIGTSLIYWSSIEWTYYYTSPPFGLEAKSQAAAQYAAMYGMFHWGPLAWAFYSLTAFPIGYAYYNRKKGGLRLSTACAGVIGEKNSKGTIGKIIDILLVFGLVGGTGTTLASGTPMLAEALSQLIGVAHTPVIDITVVVVWTCIFVTSVTLGLKKGIKVLSDINLITLIILCSIVFIGGPTYFMLNLFTDSVGLMLSEFTRMTFYTDAIGQSMFPQWWTIFYWAWWVAYGPYMGIFIARISKGRTFRDIGLTVTIAGSAGCMLFFMLFGNNTMYAELNGLYPVIDTIKDESASVAILGVLMQLPLEWLILPLFILVGFVYSGTTVDSSAYVLASITSKELKEGQEPSRSNRLFWAIALGGTGLILMNAGGLAPIKTASLIVGVPLVFIMGVSFLSLLKWLKEDYPEYQVDDLKVKATEDDESALIAIEEPGMTFKES